MNEVVVRALVVTAIVLGVAGLAWSQRRPRGVKRSDLTLEPGVYLYSSISCLECDPARARLIERLGPDGFVEISWEKERNRFEESGVEVVPSTLLVADDGAVTVVEGVPGPILDSFSP